MLENVNSLSNWIPCIHLFAKTKRIIFVLSHAWGISLTLEANWCIKLA